MKYEIEGTDAAGHIAGVIPAAVADLARRELGSRVSVEAEISAMCDAVRDFWEQEPDQVMRACSAYTARCTEMYIQLHRIEARERQWKQVRTQQVVPLLDELDRQYRNSSRMLEIRRQDLDQIRGQM